MATYHISLAFNTANPNPPNPNPNNWTGSLQYGFCDWNGTNCTDPETGDLPEPDNGDIINFAVYQVGGTTTTPSTTGLGTGNSWISVTPINGTPSDATAFVAPISTIQGASLLSVGNMHSAVFNGTFPCWAISGDGSTVLNCEADNPNGTNGEEEEFNLVFQINVGGNIYGIDPTMIVKP